MKTACLILASFALVAQVSAETISPNAPAAVASVLDYGGLGALILVLAAVFLRLLPAHQATVEKITETHQATAEKIAEAHQQTVSTLVKEHKDGLSQIAAAHERSSERLANEIKSWRVS